MCAVGRTQEEALLAAGLLDLGWAAGLQAIPLNMEDVRYGVADMDAYRPPRPYIYIYISPTPPKPETALDCLEKPGNLSNQVDILGLKPLLIISPIMELDKGPWSRGSSSKTLLTPRASGPQGLRASKSPAGVLGKRPTPSRLLDSTPPTIWLWLSKPFWDPILVGIGEFTAHFRSGSLAARFGFSDFGPWPYEGTKNLTPSRLLDPSTFGGLPACPKICLGRFPIRHP